MEHQQTHNIRTPIFLTKNFKTCFIHTCNSIIFEYYMEARIRLWRKNQRCLGTRIGGCYLRGEYRVGFISTFSTRSTRGPPARSSVAFLASSHSGSEAKAPHAFSLWAISS